LARLAALLCLLGALTAAGLPGGKRFGPPIDGTVAATGEICPGTRHADGDAPSSPPIPCDHCIQCALGTPVDAYGALDEPSWRAPRPHAASAPAFPDIDRADRSAGLGQWHSGAPPPAASAASGRRERA
jgi:hypothetical protein